jgi:hypothetical protein
METWKKEECAIVGGGGTNQRASFMNFIGHYSHFHILIIFNTISLCFVCLRTKKWLCLQVSPESTKKRVRDGLAREQGKRARRTDGGREELREICREVIAQNERQLQLCGTHFEWRKQRESREKICTIGRKEICTTLLFSLSCLLLASSRVMNGKRRLTSRWVILICFRGICPCRSHVFEEKRNNEWMNEWMKEERAGKKED